MQIYNREHNVFVVCNVGSSFNRHYGLKFDNFRLRNIVGLVVNDNSLQFCSQDDCVLSKTFFSNTLTWTGEWIGMFFDDVQQLGLFSTDFFGFGHIFYGVFDKNGERFLIVGDSFRGVNRAIKDILGSFGINWDIALPHLVSPQTIFEGRISYRTFSRDINVLHENEVLIFGREGISIVKKPICKTLDNLSYSQLIYRGIEKAQNMLRVALSLGRPLELSLSGGKDSRAVLGLILSSGYHQDIKVYTALSNTVADGASREILDLDFKLACQLTEYFGLRWNTNNNYSCYDIDFNEAIDFWQDHRGGLSFNFRPKFRHYIGRQEVHLTGGGGELLRNSIVEAYKKNFSSWWNSCGGESGSIGDDLVSLYRYLCDNVHIDNDLYNYSARAFSSSMTFDDALNVLDCLMLGDMRYDNRNHFSIGHTSFSQGVLLSYLLCVPEFFIATRHLSPMENQNGKVLFDIIEYTCPDLHTLSYASPAWSSDFKTKGIKDWSAVSGRKQMQSYSQLLESRELIKNIREKAGYNFYQCCKDRLIVNMNRLRDFAISCDIDFFDGINQRVARLYQLSEKHLAGLVSKTETLIDVIDQTHVCYRTVVVDVLASKFITQSNPFWHSYTASSSVKNASIQSFSNLCSQLDMSDFSFIVNMDINKNIISINYKNIAEECEIACYLYENGMKIDQIWYQECTSMSFSVKNLNLDNRYRVTVFYRWKGERIAQKTESRTLN